MKTFKELLEGKFLDTHLKNGRPNPNHPAYATHKATYDQVTRTPKNESVEKPGDLVHHIPGIAKVYKGDRGYQVHREIHHKVGPTTSHHIDTYDSKEYAIKVAKTLTKDETVNEEWQPDALDKGSADAHALSKSARNDETGHVHVKALAAHKNMLAAHKEAHAKVAPQHKRFHELAIRDHETQIKRHTQMAKAMGHLKESEEVDGVDNDISKEQRKIYDDQTKAFMKDRKANAGVKESVSFKDFIDESTFTVVHHGHSTGEGVFKMFPKGKRVINAVTKYEKDAIGTKKMLVNKGFHQVEMYKNGKLVEDVELDEGTDKPVDHKVGDVVYAKTDKAYKTMTGTVSKVGRTHTTITHKDGSTGMYKHKDISQDFPYDNPYRKESVELDEVTHSELLQGAQKAYIDATRQGNGVMAKHYSSQIEKHKAAIAKEKKNRIKEDVEPLDESPFDWKAKPSEIDWSDDKKKSDDGGTVHKARTKNRNPEGGALEKKPVGRPTGWKGEHKIDRAKRDTPEYKAELSKKVMSAKADGFKERGEFTSIVNRGLAQKQLKDAGLNPDDHKAAIEKQVKKAAGKFYSPHGQ